MNSRKMIKNLSVNNNYMYNLNDIINIISLSSDKAIDLMEISYNNLIDSQETIIIDEEIYDYLIKSEKQFVLIGKRVSNCYRNYIYITDYTRDDGQNLDLGENDVFILYYPMQKLGDIKDTTLEQDRVLDYFNNNRENFHLRRYGMNLTVQDIKNLINFEQGFYGSQIMVFNLIKNGDELNIIYDDNGIIKCVVNLFVMPKKYTGSYIPINTFFNHTNSNQYRKRKVRYYE